MNVRNACFSISHNIIKKFSYVLKTLKEKIEMYTWYIFFKICNSVENYVWNYTFCMETG